VRELRNIVERASLLADGHVIEPAHLPDEVAAAGASRAPDAPAETGGPVLRAAERDALARALNEHDGNRRELARALGLSERTLYRKLAAYGLVGRKSARPPTGGAA